MRATYRSTFRQMTAVEERMLRACMPKVSEKDSQGLREDAKPVAARPVATRTLTLTFKLSEVRS